MSATFALALAAGCQRAPVDRVQGYIEGEFVYVSSPLAGTLESVEVHRGMEVKQGQRLFALEAEPEKHALDEAVSQKQAAVATLEDAKQGKRPSEIEALEAQLKQAIAASALAESDLARQEELARRSVNAPEDLDRARATRDEQKHRVAQLEADLTTAQQGARTNQIAAAESNVEANQAKEAKARWDLSQKTQAAPQAGHVFDVVYRPGEWVPAGRPVVVLLPPQNIKVRAFVPEGRVGTLKLGDRIEVLVDGVGQGLTGTISFISPQAEYTPPVIYSRESRSKLVFLIEAVFSPEVSNGLHPGQPVDVKLSPGA